MALVKYDAGYANGSYGYGESQPQMNYYRHPGSVTTVMAKMHGMTVNPRSDGGKRRCAVKKHTPLKEVSEEEDSEDEESEEEDSEDEESEEEDSEDEENEESDSEESEDESDSEEESDCEEKLAPAPGPYGGAARFYGGAAGGYGGTEACYGVCHGLDGGYTLKCAREKQTGGKLGGGAGWAAYVAAGGSKLCPEPRGQRHDDYYSQYWQEKKHARRHWPAPRDEDEHTHKKKKKKKKKKHTGKVWPRTGGPPRHQPEEKKVSYKYKFYF